MKKELGIGILLVVVCIIIGLKNPSFVGAVNLGNQARLIGISGIFSIGMGLVIISGGIDLSVGSVFAVQGVLLVMALREWNWPWPIAVLASIAVVVAVGALNGAFISKIKMQPFIVTLCGLMFYRGISRYIAQDNSKGFGNEGFPQLRSLMAGSLGPIPMPFVFLVVVSILMYVLLHKSVFGRYLYAVGRNEDAARYSGINTQAVILWVYVINGVLVAISGLLFAFYTNSISPSNHGLSYELYGIAAAVLGGCSLRGGEGTILGILIGTVLMQVLRNSITLLNIPSPLELSVIGAVIFAGVLVDQLLGQRKKKPAAVEAPKPGPTAGAGSLS